MQNQEKEKQMASSRILKFRAWDEDGFMFTPTKIEFNKLKDGDTWVWNGEIFGQLGSAVVDLMQYTGLKDKNGKDIYEGDIVSFDKNNFEVRWFPKWAMFGLKGECRYKYQSNPEEDPLGSSGSSTSYKPYHLTGYYLKKIEVIGNIYENPELLS